VGQALRDLIVPLLHRRRVLTALSSGWQHRVTHNPPVLPFTLRDVIYDPVSKENEQQSARLFQAFAQEFALEDQQCAVVDALILATETHSAANARREYLSDLQFFLDIDLAVLACHPAEYDDYAMLIRQEYIHLPDHEFIVGRSKVLNSLLSKARLFETDHFHERFEQRARRNLQRELCALAAAPSTRVNSSL